MFRSVLAVAYGKNFSVPSLNHRVCIYLTIIWENAKFTDDIKNGGFVCLQFSCLTHLYVIFKLSEKFGYLKFFTLSTRRTPYLMIKLLLN